MREQEFEEFMREKTKNPEFTLNGKPRAQIPRPEPQIQPPVVKESGVLTTEMWTDLYQPTKREDLVGNEGLVHQLEDWLKDWDDVHIRGNKKSQNFHQGN